MITVIIPTLDDERRLVPTLASLVSGAADGLIVEAIVADGGSRDGTETVADVAGCRFIRGDADAGARLAAAAAGAKAPWLLFLPPGVVLDEGWIRDVRAFLDQVTRRGESDRRAAIFALGTDDYGMAAALRQTRARLGLWLGRGADPDQGLLISAGHYRALGGHGAGAGTASRLTRRLGATRIVTLRSRATAIRF
ncbi:glycosyltransferase [Phreatobacter sp.]|uniref:glycosyltransferase n=1 Tax=Phreatobacter sp. TaxID=1966341 RepID=UPI0022C2546F|nr:glycosyltransferase [Phreatobacter sp.]MCZ8316151.1 glycosyltransferase [Phreatobacter sp.]